MPDAQSFEKTVKHKIVIKPIAHMHLRVEEHLRTEHAIGMRAAHKSTT